MEKKSLKEKSLYVSEEEKTLDWNEIQSSFQKTFGNEVYSSWLKNITLLKEFNDYLVLGVPTRFFRDWIVSRYLDKILEQIKSHKMSLNRVEFKISEENKSIQNNNLDNNESNKITEIKDSILNYNRLNPNLNFENFIEGNSNKIALSSSKKICQQISRYNPLYIYGGVGLGKTHLLNAIGIELQEQTNVMFISAERFMYQFVKSIKSNDMVKFKEYFRNTDILLIDDIQFMNGKEAMQEEFFHTFNALLDKGSQVIISAERFMYQFVKSIKSNDMVKFKEYFRNTDILLIDDIQFMNGKEAMQEEFFHTFNALLDKGSQIIVSADRAPNKLSRIQERIKSRFSGGLVVDIQNPDYELRKKIVERKTEELNKLYSDKVKISKEIQDYISTEITVSIRELVGAINRVVSFSRIYNKIPNLAETKIVLKDLLNLTENKVTIDLIQTLVCKFFKISKNEMLSSRRSRYLVRPRQTAIYLTKILTSKSLPEIGREFSNRDHTTIIHSVKTIEKLKEKDPEMVENINKLKNQILYNNKDNEI